MRKFSSVVHIKSRISEFRGQRRTVEKDNVSTFSDKVQRKKTLNSSHRGIRRMRRMLWNYAEQETVQKLHAGYLLILMWFLFPGKESKKNPCATQRATNSSAVNTTKYLQFESKLFLQGWSTFHKLTLVPRESQRTQKWIHAAQPEISFSSSLAQRNAINTKCERGSLGTSEFAANTIKMLLKKLKWLAIYHWECTHK